MFEAFQERPQYWDGMPYDRFVTLSRGGDNRDWIKSWQRVARELLTIDDAIAYAKRILAQRPGCPVEIIRRVHVSGQPRYGLNANYRSERIAIVSRDALGRTWCDSFDEHGLI